MRRRHAQTFDSLCTFFRETWHESAHFINVSLCGYAFLHARDAFTNAFNAFLLETLHTPPKTKLQLLQWTRMRYLVAIGDASGAFLCRYAMAFGPLFGISCVERLINPYTKPFIASMHRTFWLGNEQQQAFIHTIGECLCSSATASLLIAAPTIATAGRLFGRQKIVDWRAMRLAFWFAAFYGGILALYRVENMHKKGCFNATV